MCCQSYRTFLAFVFIYNFYHLDYITFVKENEGSVSNMNGTYLRESVHICTLDPLHVSIVEHFLLGSLSNFFFEIFFWFVVENCIILPLAVQCLQ